ncbi:hypothetical protein FS749_007325 [Ceratobasidium sp. UAMH 11750]|nr:hypothetical protein FS749_007325 [Ceratobasidium sp. UAMH 11750]
MDVLKRAEPLFTNSTPRSRARKNQTSPDLCGEGQETSRLYPLIPKTMLFGYMLFPAYSLVGRLSNGALAEVHKKVMLNTIVGICITGALIVGFKFYLIFGSLFTDLGTLIDMNPEPSKIEHFSSGYGWV